MMLGLSQCERFDGEWKDIGLLDNDGLINQEGGEVLLKESVLALGVVLHEQVLGVGLLSLALQLSDRDLLVRESAGDLQSLEG